MFDYDFEKFILEGIAKVDQLIKQCHPGELYTLADIMILLGVDDTNVRDFYHVVLHCHHAIDVVYQVECKQCKHASLVKGLGYVANSVCPFCHSKNLKVTELFQVRSSVVQVFGDHKCSFCGRKIKAGFMGRDNKIICKDCVKKFTLLVKEGIDGKKKKGS